jgi:hypothetical protein
VPKQEIDEKAKEWKERKETKALDVSLIFPPLPNDQDLAVDRRVTPVDDADVTVGTAVDEVASLIIFVGDQLIPT